MDDILKQYRQELTELDYSPGLIDYLCRLAASSLASIDTLNSFTEAHFKISIEL